MSGLDTRSRALTPELEAISPSFGYGEFARLLRHKGSKMVGIVFAFAPCIQPNSLIPFRSGL